jgi:predicted permease
MTGLRVWLSRAVDLLLRRRRDARLDEEVQSHLNLLTDEFVLKGLSRDEARLAARKAFGGGDQIKARYRDRRGLPSVDAFVQDLRFALRLMRKSKGFSLVAAGSLAVSIGAITLAFSAVNAFVWRPLPIRDPASLFSLQPLGWSYLDYRDIRDHNTALDSLIGYRIAMMNLGVPGEPALVWGYLATGNYFDALGVSPALGRFFTPQEDQQPGAAPFAVLSYDTWQARFGGRPDIVGRAIDINGAPYTIVGVAPQDFHGVEAFYRPEVWVPLMMQRQIEAGSDWLDSRTTSNLMVAARLKPGVTRERGEAMLAVSVTDLSRRYPNRNTRLTLTLARPGFFGNMLGGPARAFAWGLFGLGTLLLLTACSNLAGLLLARSTDRAREIALRAALGAGRARIARQLMTESLVLALCGGSGGLALAWLSVRLLAQMHLPVEIPVQIDLSAPWTIAAFSATVALLVGLLVGLAPSRFASTVDLNTSFKGPAAFRVGRQRWHARDVLVGAQVALCLVLLHACFLSVRGLQRLTAASIGWNPDRLVMAATELGLARYDKGRIAAFHRRLLEEARQMPGVEAAAIGSSLPLHIGYSSTTVFTDPVRVDIPGERAAIYQASEGYLRTLQIPLRFGRDFSTADIEESPQVAIVNGALAEKLFGRVNAVGQRVRLGRGGTPVEIVGIVEDGKYQSLGETRSAVVFRPTTQWHTNAAMVFARVAPAAAVTGRDLRQLLLRIDPALPIRMTATGDDIAALPLFPYRTAVAALTTLGLVASGLLLTGLHALMAYAAARRQREIGVRLALGADRPAVAQLILGRAGVILGAGVAVGSLVTLGTGPLLSSLVLGASPRDPVLLLGLVLVLALIVFVSCLGPVRRSLRVTPIAALRED